MSGPHHSAPRTGKRQLPLGVGITVVGGLFLAAIVLLLFGYFAPAFRAIPPQIIKLIDVLFALLAAALLFGVLTSTASVRRVPNAPGVTLGGPAALFFIVLTILLKNPDPGAPRTLSIRVHEANGSDINGAGRVTVLIGPTYQNHFNVGQDGRVDIPGLADSFAGESLTVTAQIAGYKSGSVHSKMSSDALQVIDVPLEKVASRPQLRGVLIPQDSVAPSSYALFINGTGNIAPDLYGHFILPVDEDSGATVKIEIYRGSSHLKDTTLRLPPPDYLTLSVRGVPSTMLATTAAATAKVPSPEATSSTGGTVENATKTIEKAAITAVQPQARILAAKVTDTSLVPVVQHVRTDTYTQTGGEDKTVCGPSVPDGWSIVPASVRPMVEFRSGVASLVPVEVSRTKVCFATRTAHVLFSMPAIRWHYEYDTQRDTPKSAKGP